MLSYDLHWNPVTLIQRHGRVDRITTEHEEIYLHNMMPDPAVESAIGIRETVSGRVQAFHDLIGLDNVVLENGEKVNPESIYAIYDGQMPEEPEDINDSLAVAQQAQRAVEPHPPGAAGAVATPVADAQRTSGSNGPRGTPKRWFDHSSGRQRRRQAGLRREPGRARWRS